jgi:hypothetical protein
VERNRSAWNLALDTAYPWPGPNRNDVMDTSHTFRRNVQLAAMFLLSTGLVKASGKGALRSDAQAIILFGWLRSERIGCPFGEVMVDTRHLHHVPLAQEEHMVTFMVVLDPERFMCGETVGAPLHTSALNLEVAASPYRTAVGWSMPAATPHGVPSVRRVHRESCAGRDNSVVKPDAAFERGEHFAVQLTRRIAPLHGNSWPARRAYSGTDHHHLMRCVTGAGTLIRDRGGTLHGMKV